MPDRWRRANARYAPTLVDLEDLNLILDGSGPAEVVDWRESLSRVNTAMRHLPEMACDIVDMNK